MAQAQGSTSLQPPRSRPHARPPPRSPPASCSCTIAAFRSPSSAFFDKHSKMHSKISSAVAAMGLCALRWGNAPAATPKPPLPKLLPLAPPPAALGAAVERVFNSAVTRAMQSWRCTSCSMIPASADRTKLRRTRAPAEQTRPSTQADNEAMALRSKCWKIVEARVAYAPSVTAASASQTCSCTSASSWQTKRDISGKLAQAPPHRRQAAL